MKRAPRSLKSARGHAGVRSSRAQSIPGAEELWKVAWTYIRTVIDTAREPFLVLDEDLRVLSANRMFYSFFSVKRRDTEHTLIFDLGDGQWNIPALRKLLMKVLPKNSHFQGYEVDHVFPLVGRKILILNARRVYMLHSKKPILLLAMEDITMRKELEEKLRTYTARLNAEVMRRTNILEEKVKLLERSQKLSS